MTGSKPFREQNLAQKTFTVLGTIGMLVIIVAVLLLTGKWLVHAYLWLWHRA